MGNVWVNYLNGFFQILAGLMLITIGVLGVIERWKAGSSSSAWTRRYSRSQRGFAIAPILYVLGLIGVMSGVIFSSNTQILRTNQNIQNGMTAKSDLQAASNTLSAQSVFSSNGLMLCPPRSTHQTNGTPCALTPVSLVQFADYTGGNLPVNYANTSTNGSPTEVGVFAAGSGIKVLDPWRHAYLYCRWENPRSSPSSNAFVLLSAGADGKLQTKCGDTTAQGDDYYLSITVGTAINRAALWQANGTNNVTYGATGTQVTIDNSGDVLAAGKITAANAVISGTVAIGTTQAAVSLDIYSTAQIETLGTANGQQANINLVTKADGNILGTANNKGWSVSGRGDNYCQCQDDDFVLSYWNGTSWIQPVTITPAGYVGLFTNTPGAPLQVNGSVAIGYSASVTPPSDGLLVNGNVGIGISPSTSLEIQGVDGADSFRLWNTADTAFFTLKPEMAAHQGTFGYWTGSYFGKLDFPASETHLYGNGAEVLRVASSGWVGIGTTNPSALFTVQATSGNDSAHFTNGSGSAFVYVNSTGSSYGQIGVYGGSGGLPLILNASGGYVGVNTVSPQATLDVSGFLKLAAQGSSPVSCAIAVKGSIAMTTNNGLCFCNGTAWKKVESPTTACAW